MEKKITTSELSLKILHDGGLNPWAVQLLTESFNKIKFALPPEGVSFVFNNVRIQLKSEPIPESEVE